MTKRLKLLLVLVLSLFTALTVAIGVGVNTVKADGSVFAMEDGVYLKTSATGMRFIAKMDEATYQDLKTDDNKTLKFIIAPKVLFDNVTDGKYIDMEQKIVVEANDYGKYYKQGDFYYVNGCVYDMKTANLKLDYTAIAVIVTAGDSATYTYAEAGDTVRNVYEVVNSAILDENTENTAELLEVYDFMGSADYPIVVKTTEEYAVLVNGINGGAIASGVSAEIDGGVDKTVATLDEGKEIVEVAGLSLVWSEDFSGDKLSSRWDYEYSEAYGVSNSGYLTVNATVDGTWLESKQSFENVKSYQFDFKFNGNDGQWVSFSNDGTYSGPFYFYSRANIEQLSATFTETNAISGIFGSSTIDGKWITIKYVVTASDKAELYMGYRGETVSKVLDLTFSAENVKYNLGSGKVKVVSGGAVNFSIDNFEITFNDDTTVTDDFYSAEDSLFNITRGTFIDPTKGLFLLPENDSYVEVVASADGVTARTEKSFSNIEYFQWDMRLTTNNNWRSVSNGSSIYAGTFMFTGTYVAAGLKATIPDTVYFSSLSGFGLSDITNKWVTFKYVVKSEDSAELWIALRGGQFVKVTDMTFSEANKAYNFTSGTIGFGGAVADNYDLDNLIVKTSDEIYVNLFNTATTSLVASNSTITKKSTYNGKNIDNGYVSVACPAGQAVVTKDSYSNIEYVQWDIRFKTDKAWRTLTNKESAYGCAVAFTNTYVYDNIFNGPGADKVLYADTIGVADVTNKWVTFKFVVTSETTAELWAAVQGETLVKIKDLTYTEGGSTTNLTSGLFGIGSGGGDDFDLANVIIKTADETYTETFNGANSIFKNSSFITGHVSYKDFDAELELKAPYIQLKSEFDMTESDAISIEIDYKAEENGAFGIGLSATEFVSVSHLEGAYELKLNKNGEYSSTKVALEDLANNLVITLYKTGKITVKVNGGAETELGTVSTENLKVTLISFNYQGSVNVFSVKAYK